MGILSSSFAEYTSDDISIVTSDNIIQDETLTLDCAVNWKQLSWQK